MWAGGLGAAGLPQTLNYQGRMRLTSGASVADGNGHSVVAKIYDSGNTNLWTETHTGVTTTAGLFNIILGSITPLNLPFNDQYTLGINFDGDGEMSPRTPLTMAPYAFRAKFAESTGLPISGTAALPGGALLYAENNDSTGLGIQGVGSNVMASSVGVYGLGGNGIVGESTVGGGTGVSARQGSGAYALRVSGSASFDWGTVDFSGATVTGLSLPGVPVPLSLTNAANSDSTINAANTSSGTGVYGRAMGAGTSPAVYGFRGGAGGHAGVGVRGEIGGTATSGAAGLQAVNTSVNPGTYALLGSSQSEGVSVTAAGSSAAGVYAEAAFNGPGTTYGVRGISQAQAGYGVAGENTTPSGTGVFGRGGIGVLAQTNAGAGAAMRAEQGVGAWALDVSGSARFKYGNVDFSGTTVTGLALGVPNPLNLSATAAVGVVEGENYGSGPGVKGSATTAAAGVAGVVGQNTAPGGVAVYGSQYNAGVGVQGDAEDGVGVLGQASGAPSGGTGVKGMSGNNGSVGVHGQVQGALSVGVLAESQSGTALRLSGTAVIDSASNTVFVASYISFAAGTNLATSIPSPLYLTASSGGAVLSGNNLGGGNGVLGTGGAGSGNAGVAGILSPGGFGFGVMGSAPSSNSANVGLYGSYGVVQALSSTGLVSAGAGGVGQNEAAGGIGLLGLAANGTGVLAKGGSKGLDASGSSYGVFAASVGSYGVWGQSGGTGPTVGGVVGQNTAAGTGVVGLGTNGAGVYGTSTNGEGVRGESNGAAAGVHGISYANGYGVQGHSNSGTAVYGDTAGTTGTAAVYGVAFGAGAVGVQGNAAAGTGASFSGVTGAVLGGNAGPDLLLAGNGRLAAGAGVTLTVENYVSFTAGTNLASGLALPFNGAGAAPPFQAALSVTNTGGGSGLRGEATQPGFVPGSVDFNSNFPAGVVGFSAQTGSAGVVGMASAMTDAAGVAGIGNLIGVYGHGKGAGYAGLFEADGLGGGGVKGYAVSGVAGTFQGLSGVVTSGSAADLALTGSGIITSTSSIIMGSYVSFTAGSNLTAGVPVPLNLNGATPIEQAVLSGSNTGAGYGVLGRAVLPGVDFGPNPFTVDVTLTAGTAGFSSASLSAGVLGKSYTGNPAAAGVIGIAKGGTGVIGVSQAVDGQGGNFSAVSGTGLAARGVTAVAASANNPGELALWAKGSGPGGRAIQADGTVLIQGNAPGTLLNVVQMSPSAGDNGINAYANSSGSAAILGVNTDSNPPMPGSSSGAGVEGQGPVGVLGTNTIANGIGVLGYVSNSASPAVMGYNNGNGVGVQGESVSGVGVRAAGPVRALEAFGTAPGGTAVFAGATPSGRALETQGDAVFNVLGASSSVTFNTHVHFNGTVTGLSGSVPNPLTLANTIGSAVIAGSNGQGGGVGVQGSNVSAMGNDVGVLGQVSSTGANTPAGVLGVIGFTTSTPLGGAGVVGNGGIFGHGVYAEAQNEGWAALYARHSSSNSGATAVLGEVNGSFGNPVFGVTGALQSAPYTFTATTATAVYGWGADSGYGVMGAAHMNSYAGVLGQHTNAGVGGVGVQGEVGQNSTGYGVVGVKQLGFDRMSISIPGYFNGGGVVGLVGNNGQFGVAGVASGTAAVGVLAKHLDGGPALVAQGKTLGADVSASLTSSGQVTGLAVAATTQAGSGGTAVGLSVTADFSTFGGQAAYGGVIQARGDWDTAGLSVTARSQGPLDRPGYGLWVDSDRVGVRARALDASANSPAGYAVMGEGARVGVYGLATRTAGAPPFLGVGVAAESTYVALSAVAVDDFSGNSGVAFYAFGKKAAELHADTFDNLRPVVGVSLDVVNRDNSGSSGAVGLSLSAMAQSGNAPAVGLSVTARGPGFGSGTVTGARFSSDGAFGGGSAGYGVIGETNASSFGAGVLGTASTSSVYGVWARNLANGTALEIDPKAEWQGTFAVPPTSAGSSGAIYFDSGSGKFKVSQAGGAWQDLVSGGGSFVAKAGDNMSGTLGINSTGAFGLNAESTSSGGIGVHGRDVSSGGWGGWFEGLGMGVRAESTGGAAIWASGSTLGVSATASGTGPAVYARNNASGAAATAIYAQNDSVSVNSAGLLAVGATGVIGATSNAPAFYSRAGVYGESNIAAVPGIFALNYGGGNALEAYGTNGAGVSATSGSLAGVLGYSSAIQAAGVEGVGLQSGANYGYGVRGRASLNDPARNAGLFGSYGAVAAPSGMVNGAGVVGSNNQAGGWGVYGMAPSGVAVVGAGGNVGVSATAAFNGIALYARGQNNISSAAVGMAINDQSAGNGFWGQGPGIGVIGTNNGTVTYPSYQAGVVGSNGTSPGYGVFGVNTAGPGGFGVYGQVSNLGIIASGGGGVGAANTSTSTLSNPAIALDIDGGISMRTSRTDPSAGVVNVALGGCTGTAPFVKTGAGAVNSNQIKTSSVVLLTCEATGGVTDSIMARVTNLTNGSFGINVYTMAPGGAGGCVGLTNVNVHYLIINTR